MVRTLIPFSARFPRSIDSFRREMDELFDGFLSLNNTEPVHGFSPQTNLAETDGGYEVSVDLPGMQADEFNVELNGNELWITGERKQESEDEGKTYHRVERHYGTFRRTLSLPSDVDAAKINAEYKDGVLRVTIPKAETAKPTKIEVKN